MLNTDFIFPVEQKLATDYLRENFWKCNYTSVSAPLQYWVLLPNTVKVIKVDPITHNDLNFTVIGQYSTVDDSPYLEVQVIYEHIKYEMNPADWLVKKLAIMGETVLNVREIKGSSTGNYLDVLTLKKWPSGENIISRFTVLKDSDALLSGANIFCIKASCLEADYNNYAYIIFQIVANWDLINKSTWQMAESLFPFEYDFTEKVTFFVPESWEIKFEKNNNNLFSSFLFEHNLLGENKGLINAHFYALTTEPNVESVFKKSFSRIQDFKIELSPLINEESLNPHIIDFFTSTGTIALDEQGHIAFLKICILKTINGWYYFEQLGPQANLENDYWEINKRTIELILDSFNNMDFARKPVTANASKPAAKNDKDNPRTNNWLPNDWNKH